MHPHLGLLRLDLPFCRPFRPRSAWTRANPSLTKRVTRQQCVRVDARSSACHACRATSERAFAVKHSSHIRMGTLSLSKSSAHPVTPHLPTTLWTHATAHWSAASLTFRLGCPKCAMELDLRRMKEAPTTCTSTRARLRISRHSGLRRRQLKASFQQRSSL